MDNVPGGVHHPTVVRNAGQAANGGAGRDNKRRKVKLIALAVSGAVALVLVIMVGWLIYRSSTTASIDSDKYQAVFLSNGQLYFGKLQYLNTSYLKLTDVFYLQSQTATPDESDSQNPQGANQGADLQLIKLGNELHGPEDEMIINKDEIVLFENLKPDGKVSDTINQYRQSQNN